MREEAAKFHREVTERLDALAAAAQTGEFDDAVTLLTECIEAGGVVQVFGSGHSEAFAMEMAGRAGGLIPSSRIALRDVVLRGSRPLADLSGSALERDPAVVGEILDTAIIGGHDVFIIASNSGVNGSIVGMALTVKERGHRLIAVTSLAHTNAVEAKHPSGKRLSEVADVVIDNRAPYGDTTISLPGGAGVGAVSSITAAYIAQLLTIGTVERLAQGDRTPPVYISANIPGGDQHNQALEKLYEGRIRREA